MALAPALFIKPTYNRNRLGTMFAVSVTKFQEYEGGVSHNTAPGDHPSGRQCAIPDAVEMI